MCVWSEGQNRHIFTRKSTNWLTIWCGYLRYTSFPMWDCIGNYMMNQITGEIIRELLQNITKYFISRFLKKTLSRIHLHHCSLKCIEFTSVIFQYNFSFTICETYQDIYKVLTICIIYKFYKRLSQWQSTREITERLR